MYAVWYVIYVIIIIKESYILRIVTCFTEHYPQLRSLLLLKLKEFTYV
nr:MAG TPA: hypothetical protein [Bacteriophage sp.]